MDVCCAGATLIRVGIIEISGIAHKLRSSTRAHRGILCSGDHLKATMIVILGMAIWLGSAISFAGNAREPLSKIPTGQRQALTNRLNAYVKAHRSRAWGELYDLVSDTGRGGVPRQTFVSRMNAQHGTGFANSPDLLGFRPARAEAGIVAGYDIYGCGRSQREGMMFKGVAVVHAVFEHNDWFFTGWSFTEFPNESCNAISDPAWKAEYPVRWDKPMDEVVGLPEDIPIPSTAPK